MPNRKVHIGEGRRLTAAWLNIMAAGIVSAGTVPLLMTLALDGWGSRARALLLLPCFAFALGMALHLVGRMVVREKTSIEPGLHFRFHIVTSRGGAPDEDQGPTNNPGRFPTENDIDAVLEEFENDARAAIRALLCDLEALAADHDASASRAPSAQGRSALTVRF
jgi:hypothetical protein